MAPSTPHNPSGAGYGAIDGKRKSAYDNADALDLEGSVAMDAHDAYAWEGGSRGKDGGEMEMEEDYEEEISSRPTFRGAKQWFGASACALAGAGVFMVSMGFFTDSGPSHGRRKFDHVVISSSDAAPEGVKVLSASTAKTSVDDFCFNSRCVCDHHVHYDHSQALDRLPALQLHYTARHAPAHFVSFLCSEADSTQKWWYSINATVYDDDGTFDVDACGSNDKHVCATECTSDTNCNGAQGSRHLGPARVQRTTHTPHHAPRMTHHIPCTVHRGACPYDCPTVQQQLNHHPPTIRIPRVVRHGVHRGVGCAMHLGNYREHARLVHVHVRARHAGCYDQPCCARKHGGSDASGGDRRSGERSSATGGAVPITGGRDAE